MKNGSQGQYYALTKINNLNNFISIDSLNSFIEMYQLNAIFALEVWITGAKHLFCLSCL